MLVASGYNNGTYLASAELYDPGTATWTPTGSMNTARYGHVATLIPNGPLAGKVLVVGGLGENYVPQSSAELYDSDTELWVNTGSMTLARFGGDLTTLSDGSILMVGGVTCCPYLWFNKAESFDPLNQSWSPTTPKTTKAQGAAILMPNGVVLVAGAEKVIRRTPIA